MDTMDTHMNTHFGINTYGSNAAPTSFTGIGPTGSAKCAGGGITCRARDCSAVKESHLLLLFCLLQIDPCLAFVLERMPALESARYAAEVCAESAVNPAAVSRPENGQAGPAVAEVGEVSVAGMFAPPPVAAAAAAQDAVGVAVAAVPWSIL